MSLLIVVLLAVAGAAYFSLGWRRMDSACSRDDVAPATASGVEYGWSWSPPGFQCTYSDGTVKRSLWWST